MFDRMIIVARNKNFPRFGVTYLPATSGWCQRAGRESFVSNASELSTNTGTTPVPGPSAELMETKTANTTPDEPEAAPAASGTCRKCGGCGWNYAHYICPLSKNWTKEQVTCDRCNGSGCDEVSE